MTELASVDPLSLIQPKRKVEGLSAMLLPFDEGGAVDWASFEKLLARTVEAGLVPAVNMDTGYANLLDDATRREVLSQTLATVGKRPFVAGAFVADRPGDSFNLDGYTERIEEITRFDGTPVIFQSYGLAHHSDDLVIANYQQIANLCNEFIAFELGQMFAPFGRIYSLEVYRELMSISACRGAKHSSLRRELEWQRLDLRNNTRPDFRVYTGNDLAIDMVIYGSDYLLGLSALAPDAFALRDALWTAGDSRWNELNDLLQHIGFLAFREPVPAYKHSAAMFLQSRGWIACSATHPECTQRSKADSVLLNQLAVRLDQFLAELDSTPTTGDAS